MPNVSKIGVLPDDIPELATKARKEGFAYLDRLIKDFEAGKNTFAKTGEALYEVRENTRLIAVGGLNIDPYASGAAVGRVRRFYVDPDYRRRGVGTLLIQEIEHFAAKSFSELRLLTDTARGAQFYAQLGYQKVVGREHVSHFKKL